MDNKHVLGMGFLFLPHTAICGLTTYLIHRHDLTHFIGSGTDVK